MSVVRPSTLEFKKINAKNGAEIGVAMGENSISIMNELPEVILIGVENNSANHHDILMENVKPYYTRFTLFAMDSCLAAERVVDETLDFVYIDADHHKDAVLMDLKMWTPKVRKGGIIAGHDFEKLGREDGQDVQNAVLFFAKDRNVKLYAESIMGEGGENGYTCMDWWFFKE